MRYLAFFLLIFPLLSFSITPEKAFVELAKKVSSTSGQHHCDQQG